MIIKSVYVKGAHLREIEAVRSSFNQNSSSALILVLNVWWELYLKTFILNRTTIIFYLVENKSTKHLVYLKIFDYLFLGA